MHTCSYLSCNLYSGRLKYNSCNLLIVPESNVTIRTDIIRDSCLLRIASKHLQFEISDRFVSHTFSAQ